MTGLNGTGPVGSFFSSPLHLPFFITALCCILAVCAKLVTINIAPLQLPIKRCVINNFYVFFSIGGDNTVDKQNTDESNTQSQEAGLCPAP